MKPNRLTIPLVLLVILITALSLFNIACQSKQPQASDKVGDYFPLASGSSWQYRGSGNEYATFTRTVVYSNANRFQIEEDNGGTIIASIYETNDQQIKRTFFQGESYENKNLLNAKENDDTILLKMPLEVGNSWQTTKEKREINEVNAIVETPAGKFDSCLKIKISPIPSSSSAITYEYYKKGVGLVKREFVSGNDKISSTLEEYHIK